MASVFDYSEVKCKEQDELLQVKCGVLLIFVFSYIFGSVILRLNEREMALTRHMIWY